MIGYGEYSWNYLAGKKLKVLTISDFFWKCSISQFSLREEEDYSIFQINHDVFTAANSQRQNNVICQEL